MTLMSLAEYARRVGKSRAAMTQWKKAGRLVMQGDQVDVEASDAWLKKYRRDGMPKVTDDTTAVKRGRPSVKQGAEVGTQLNSEPTCLTCDEIEARLAEFDWQQTFDWSIEAQRERAMQAAQCVGFVAIESDLRDDGHWGGFQLRNPECRDPSSADAVIAGFGFELSAWEVVKHCRHEIEASVWPDTGERMFGDDDNATVVPSLLPALARPFHQHDGSGDIGSAQKHGHV
ncbi:hypothetical protein EXE55_14315 [Burkholderia glumae]|uniref:hypothetical protein n=1 Tax=Burkholderia glumae TaxID=337 RepID=UPI001373E84C|nr:hypothetical protein [Burkholderia glumae]QHP92016.1 hypothetical protein EXE55_14315 [Burkholderia glumae]